jgi:membrane associated rhomboid family serine protease
MSRFPVLTASLIVANLAGYGLELTGGGIQAVCSRHGLVPATVVATGSILPALTAMFLHAGWSHLIGNLATLAVAGAIVERSIGATRMLVVYLAAGILGGLLHVLVDPAATAPMVGASGAIFGLLAVMGARLPRTLGFVGGLAAFNIWLALSGAPGEVSFGAHLGGLAAGALFALVQQLSVRKALAS